MQKAENFTKKEKRKWTTFQVPVAWHQEDRCLRKWLSKWRICMGLHSSHHEEEISDRESEKKEHCKLSFCLHFLSPHKNATTISRSET